MSVHLFQQWITCTGYAQVMYRLCIYNKQNGTDIQTAIQTELDKVLHRQIFALHIE